MNPLLKAAKQARLDLLLAAAVNGIFFALVALMLWPAGKAIFVGRLAWGFCLFVLVTCVAFILGLVVERVARIESDPPSGSYVIMNLTLGGSVQLGWAAFVASCVATVAAGSSPWILLMLHIVGGIASWLGTMVTGSLYQGTLYKMVNMLLSFVGYVVFAVWPAAGRALFG